uniref:Uncharacterized protein n=2 Tax=Lactuca sativa TaxID=4236 RepID=A0A9R1WM65_LACSA|nr:hypothetical protein LSAT_V11C100018990 [Lactuca sativa]
MASGVRLRPKKKKGKEAVTLLWGLRKGVRSEGNGGLGHLPVAKENEGRIVRSSLMGARQAAIAQVGTVWQQGSVEGRKGSKIDCLMLGVQRRRNKEIRR